MSRSKQTIEVVFGGNSCEIEVEVSYALNKPERGAREPGTGQQLEPDYPASVDVVAVMVTNGTDKAKTGIDIQPMLSKEIIDSLAETILLDELESA